MGLLAINLQWEWPEAASSVKPPQGCEGWRTLYRACKAEGREHARVTVILGFGCDSRALTALARECWSRSCCLVLLQGICSARWGEPMAVRLTWAAGMSFCPWEGCNPAVGVCHWSSAQTCLVLAEVWRSDLIFIVWGIWFWLRWWHVRHASGEGSVLKVKQVKIHMTIQNTNSKVCNHTNSPAWSLSKGENVSFHFLLLQRFF